MAIFDVGAGAESRRGLRRWLVKTGVGFKETALPRGRHCTSVGRECLSRS